ncbi:LysR family transcriptional regulator [Ochrobactrum grignonense]|nr:LysR family transcriptional regulator [Brucella grignonensis]
MSTIHNIDLNLIRVFNALMEERNVTKAGERLNLTQSAVSHALGKLRYILSDELFVRGPQGMHPTPRAEELSQPLRSALADISAALSPVQFDPATADMSFVVATSDFYIGTLFPAVMERLERKRRASGFGFDCSMISIWSKNWIAELCISLSVLSDAFPADSGGSRWYPSIMSGSCAKTIRLLPVR